MWMDGWMYGWTAWTREKEIRSTCTPAPRMLHLWRLTFTLRRGKGKRSWVIHAATPYTSLILLSTDSSHDCYIFVNGAARSMFILSVPSSSLSTLLAVCFLPCWLLLSLLFATAAATLYMYTYPHDRSHSRFA